MKFLLQKNKRKKGKKEKKEKKKKKSKISRKSKFFGLWCARCSVSCVHVLVVRLGCGQRGFGDPKADGGKNCYDGKNSYGGKNS
jgi:hypothetical protein